MDYFYTSRNTAFCAGTHYILVFSSSWGLILISVYICHPPWWFPLDNLSRKLHIESNVIRRYASTLQLEQFFKMQKNKTLRYWKNRRLWLLSSSVNILRKVGGTLSTASVVGSVVRGGGATIKYDLVSACIKWQKWKAFFYLIKQTPKEYLKWKKKSLHWNSIFFHRKWLDNFNEMVSRVFWYYNRTLLFIKMIWKLSSYSLRRHKQFVESYLNR